MLLLLVLNSLTCISCVRDNSTSIYCNYDLAVLKIIKMEQ
jgi:hypothetical protein